MIQTAQQIERRQYRTYNCYYCGCVVPTRNLKANSTTGIIHCGKNCPALKCKTNRRKKVKLKKRRWD